MLQLIESFLRKKNSNDIPAATINEAARLLESPSTTDEKFIVFMRNSSPDIGTRFKLLQLAWKKLLDNRKQRSQK